MRRLDMAAVGELIHLVFSTHDELEILLEQHELVLSLWVPPVEENLIRLLDVPEVALAELLLDLVKHLLFELKLYLIVAFLYFLFD